MSNKPLPCPTCGWNKMSNHGYYSSTHSCVGYLQSQLTTLRAELERVNKDREMQGKLLQAQRALLIENGIPASSSELIKRYPPVKELRAENERLMGLIHRFVVAWQNQDGDKLDDAMHDLYKQALNQDKKGGE